MYTGQYRLKFHAYFRWLHVCFSLYRLETVHNDEPSNNRAYNDDYTDPDEQSPNSPPPYNQLGSPAANAPPVPPRARVNIVLGYVHA